MRCPRCQEDNPSEARFCVRCGAGLTLQCGHCGTDLPIRAAFCFACGRPIAAAAPRFGSPERYTPRYLADKILTTRHALEGERKQVTVLFADVSGFTALAARLDPEEVHGLMVGAFELILAAVHRYEGTVNQFLGDGVMALFGAPIAHEDHAQRAVHAALGIARALDGYQAELRPRRISFQVRQGLNTGLVVVGSIGSDLRMDYTAVGDTTNVAARMQQAATPGRILIAEATHRLVASHFDTRPVGRLAVKGKTEPIAAWEVTAARSPRSRLEIRAERGLTPLAGRQRELDVLADAFERAKRGQGHVVFLSGEPGIGKSRLLHELRGRLGDEAAWHEGHCLSFGRSIAFHPLIDLLRRSFGIVDGDAESTAAAKTDAAVLGLGEDLRPVLPFVRSLLSIDPGDASVSSMDPQQRRGEIFDALRRLTARAAQARPQVVVYEDLHWIDQASEEFLLFAAESVPASRTLCILTYRPGYASPFGERSYHVRLALAALPAPDTSDMASAMLAAAGLSGALAEVIARKAEGNPFFVEEVVRAFTDTSIRQGSAGEAGPGPLADMVVPDTVQDVLMARIDRLDEASKHLLQLASVIGRDVPLRLLERIAETQGTTREQLGRLMASELIQERAVLPEVAYRFNHALTQEVAYSSLLVQRRVELHRRIGAGIEELYSDRLAEQYEVLAHHFERGEAWPKALEYILKAADKAARAFATREAIALYQRAEAAADHIGLDVDPAVRMAIHRAKTELYLLVSDFEQARAEGTRALALARGGGDQASEAAALVSMAIASWLDHRFDQALDDAREAIATAELAQSPSALAGGQLATGLVLEMTGRLAQASDKFERVIQISRASGDVVNESWALVFAAEIKGWEAAFDEASRLYGEGVRLARGHNILLPLLEGLFMWGINLTGQGEYDRALALLEDGLALARKVGDENYTPRYLNSLGWLHIECGNLDHARELNLRAAEGARARRDDESVANAELNLGDIALMTGDLGLAGDLLEKVHRQVANPATSEWMRWRYSLHLFAGLAEFRLARGDLVKARDFTDHLLELATRTRSRKYLVQGWRLRGEIARARRQWDDGEAALSHALQIAQAIGSPTQLWKTHQAAARLHAEAGRSGPARTAQQAARTVIDRVKTSLGNATLRASLERAPHIRALYHLLDC